MRKSIYILFFLAVWSCNQKTTKPNSDLKKDTLNLEPVTSEHKTEIIKYSEFELVSFLDSVGNLNKNELIKKVSNIPDSVFKSYIQINLELQKTDFEKLKDAIKKGILDLETANKIFGSFEIENYFPKDSVPITFFSFDKNKFGFKEYAILIGYPNADSSCELYLFNNNKIISKHNIYHRYGLELNHYMDADNKTVFYYKANFVSGSGIWWTNYFFYKYDNGQIIPLLNEIENSNLQIPMSYRKLWIESKIIKTNPLTIKMVYNQSLFSHSNQPSEFINDSTTVSYQWNEKTKKLIGDYNKSKINREQILTYYLDDNELLFINSYYNRLKSNLLDKNLKPITLDYLNEVKNEINK